jgi:hypothetical protein
MNLLLLVMCMTCWELQLHPKLGAGLLHHLCCPFGLPQVFIHMLPLHTCGVAHRTNQRMYLGDGVGVGSYMSVRWWLFPDLHLIDSRVSQHSAVSLLFTAWFGVGHTPSRPRDSEQVDMQGMLAAKASETGVLGFACKQGLPASPFLLLRLLCGGLCICCWQHSDQLWVACCPDQWAVFGVFLLTKVSLLLESGAESGCSTATAPHAVAALTLPGALPVMGVSITLNVVVSQTDSKWMCCQLQLLVA